MSKIENLKPCPFCGSHMIFIKKYTNGISFEGAYIYCGKCRVRTELKGERFTFEGNKEEAIESWNRRHND